MNILRSSSESPYSPTRAGTRVVRAHEEVRRSLRHGRLGTGTLACAHCDAPVAIVGARTPADTVVCPFCDRRGPLRDFLSLAAPARPARIAITVRPRG